MIRHLDMDTIHKELEQVPEYEKQIMLQGVDGQEDPFFGVGRTTTFDNQEEEFVEPIFDMPYINLLMEELNMFRTRLMKMDPNTCYSWHRDKTPRIHIPVVTHQNCQFVLAEKDWDINSASQSRHMEVGKIHRIDTTRLHTAFNGSDITRVHIVGCINATSH